MGYLRSREGPLVAGVGQAAIGAAAGLMWKGSPRAALIGAGIGAALGALPLFNRGYIEGAATAGVRAHTAYAQYVSGPLGLTRAAKEQEALMPGITQARTVLGLVGGGAMMGLFARGIARAHLLRQSKKTVKAGEDIYRAFGEKITKYQQAMKTELKEASGLFGKARAWAWPGVFKGEPAARAAMTGHRLGALAGGVLFTAFMLSAAVVTGGLPGILGTEKTGAELERIYAGEEDIEVRKGRWWEFGRSPWEGGKIQYYRPHAYHLMMTKARERALWGSEENYWEYNPMVHPLEAMFSDEFKYAWEMAHYHDRPYPMTGTYFGDVPFVGPLMSATLGRLIKPPILMHTQEWLAGQRAFHVPTAAAGESALELGGLPRGMPVSPHSADQVMGELIYRTNELRGLTGFMHGAIKEHLTGSQDYFDQLEQIETADRAIGAERAYWERDFGGLLGSTEAFRRFLPHRRRQIQLYNPLENQMPSWMPGSDFYIDFRHGDPYTKVPMGETRLPGPGYEALHPEVAGTPPEQYPLFHRYQILADVAMWSTQFKETRREVQRAIRLGELSSEQAMAIREINRRISERKKRRRFQEYQFADEALEHIRVKVQEQIRPGTFTTEKHGTMSLSGVQLAHEGIAQKNAELLGTVDHRRKQVQTSDFLREHLYPGAELDVYVHKDMLRRYGPGGVQPAVVLSGGVNLGQRLAQEGLAEYEEGAFAAHTRFAPAARALGAVWERITHFEPVTEHLTPVSPLTKFVHQRSALEEYERNRIYSRDIAMWQHPVEHFLKPAYWLGVSAAGSADLPEAVTERWEIEDYFDKLKWLKYQILETAAADEGAYEAAMEFKKIQRRTLFGVNPYGSLANIFSALPSLDRDFFTEFVDASSAEERSRIMELLPPNQRPIYQAQWQNRLARALLAQKTAGAVDSSAQTQLNALRQAKITEGRPTSPALRKQYYKEKEPGETYAEWSRRQELTDYFEQAPLPQPDWIGWHPHVDLEDIKLKLVENLGLDMHDYNLWPSRRQTFARKPYLGEALEGILEAPAGGNVLDTIRRIEAILKVMLRLENVQVHASQVHDGRDTLDLEITDDRNDAMFAYLQDSNFSGMI
jgi:hypothetical protein